jgi:hypothetical protein
MGHLLGNARVSTGDQQPHLQVDALGACRLPPVFTETASGAAADRPASTRSCTSSAPVTHWWSGSWTGWAGLKGGIR